MSESLEKLILLSNQKEILSDGEENMRNSSENNLESSKLESTQNSIVKQVDKLLSGLRLSNNQLQTEEMDVSEMEELSKKSTEFGSENKQFCLAGKIISIFENLPIVLVQPTQVENALLNIGTNLFLPKFKSETFDSDNCILLGQVEEVFGNVKDPFYAVRLFLPENNFARVEDKVYFLSSHPSTSLFHIEYGTNDKYNVIYHR